MTRQKIRADSFKMYMILRKILNTGEYKFSLSLNHLSACDLYLLQVSIQFRFYLLTVLQSLVS